MPPIHAKILSYRSPQRYGVRRALLAAGRILQEEGLVVDLSIEEVARVEDILRYTPVLVQPALMLNDRLVCVGRTPHAAEVAAWLRMALENPA